jgi:hypothetical protein
MKEEDGIENWVRKPFAYVFNCKRRLVKTREMVRKLQHRFDSFSNFYDQRGYYIVTLQEGKNPSSECNAIYIIKIIIREIDNMS